MLKKGKHIIKEINGIRCTLVEAGVTEKRMNFLNEVLQFNGFDVFTEEEKTENTTGTILYSIGVNDLVFNSMIAVYEKSLRTLDGHRVTPAYWNQLPVQEGKSYWEYREKAVIPKGTNNINPSGFKTV